MGPRQTGVGEYRGTKTSPHNRGSSREPVLEGGEKCFEASWGGGGVELVYI